jgi:hypothetical protein
MTDSLTSLHYAANGNIVNGQYVPGTDGFNLADVNDPSQLNSLPTGVKGLVYLGMVNGADATFQATVSSYAGDPNLYGFYLVDEPDPTGQWGTLATAANLKAESDWIHANLPGAKTFIVMMNMGTPEDPSYVNTYNPANTDIDLYGLDPYPVRPQFTGGVDYNVIPAAVNAAETAGIPLNDIVPVYQAFGGGDYTTYALPTASQEQQILSTWGAVVPTPAFDYAYSWGTQVGDSALVTSPDLQTVFSAHNAGTASSTTSSTSTTTSSTPTTTSTPTFSDTTMLATDSNGVTASVPVISSGSLDYTGSLDGTVHQVFSSGTDNVSATAAITSETVQFGSGDQAMSFTGPQTLTVTGGSGTDIVTAATGGDGFVAGLGTLDVFSGPGANAYLFHAGDGLLRIEDLSLSQGDTITVDKSLQGHLHESSDGSGGVMLTFGTRGHGIDIVNLTHLPRSAIHYA